MNKQSKVIPVLFFVVASVFILLISACTLPTQGSGQSLSAQIVRPVDGVRILLGTGIEVQTRVSSPGVVRSVTLQANGNTVRDDLFTNPAFHSGTTYQPWTPPSIGIYLLNVILADTAGQQISSNTITVIVEEGQPEIQTETPTPDPLTETPTETFTPDNPQVTATQNVNCRKGPSPAYNDVDALLQGQTAPILGRNQDTSWYYIDLRGIQCWVWGGAVTVTGSVNDQPLVSAPPLPITKTPSATSPPPPAYSACHDYPDLGTCSSDPMSFGGCSWDTGMNKCQP